MQIHYKRTFSWLICALAISMFALSSGCRTGSFKRPDLSKLAFWKKGDALANVPPPPARHFDPAPIDEIAESQSKSKSTDALQREIQQDFENAKRSITKSKADMPEPIRQPYKLDNANEVIDLAAASNSFQNKANEFSSGPIAGMTQAQQDFNAAMDNALSSKTQSGQDGPSSTNNLESGWKEFELPTGLKDMAKNNVDSSLDAVNKSLYDANGKLNSGLAANAKSSADAISKASNAFSNSATDLANTFNPNASSFGQSDNGFQAAVPPVNNSDSQANANGFAFQDVAKSNLNLEQPKNADTEELRSIQAEMADARMQIAALKQQIAASKQPPAAVQNSMNSMNSTIPKAPMQPLMTQSQGVVTAPPVEKIAQLNTPKFNSANSQENPTSKGPVNVLRSNQPLQPQTSQPLAPQPSENGLDYPSTPHNNFAPRTSSNQQGSQQEAQQLNSASQASFQGTNSGSMIQKATNTGPLTNPSLQNYVSEIDIPDSVLTGNSTYAPGSVHRLSPKK